MAELIILMGICGGAAFLMAAVNKFDVAAVLATISGILLVIYAIVKSNKKPTAPNSNGYK